MGQSIEQKLEQAETRITALMKSQSEKDNAAQAHAEALTDREMLIKSVRAELEDERASHTQTRQELQTTRQTVQSLNQKIAELEKTKQSAEAKAAQICASVGVPPVKISPKGEATVKGDLLAEFKAIQDPAKQMAFYRKNREQLNAVTARTFAQ